MQVRTGGTEFGKEGNVAAGPYLPKNNREAYSQDLHMPAHWLIGIRSRAQKVGTCFGLVRHCSFEISGMALLLLHEGLQTCNNLEHMQHPKGPGMLLPLGWD